MHRASVSLMDALQALYRHNPCAAASKDADLNVILKHNCDDETDHVLDKEHLITERPIATSSSKA